MGELSTIGPEALAEILTDAPEAVRTISYQQGDTIKTGIHAIPDKLKYRETDNESIKATDTAWLIFSHELQLTPNSDDFLTFSGAEHWVVYASAEDPAGVLWRVVTRG